jgi:hypothetical protein
MTEEIDFVFWLNAYKDIFVQAKVLGEFLQKPDTNFNSIETDLHAAIQSLKNQKTESAFSKYLQAAYVMLEWTDRP